MRNTGLNTNSSIFTKFDLSIKLIIWKTSERLRKCGRTHNCLVLRQLLRGTCLGSFIPLHNLWEQTFVRAVQRFFHWSTNACISWNFHSLGDNIRVNTVWRCTLADWPDDSQFGWIPVYFMSEMTTVCVSQFDMTANVYAEVCVCVLCTKPSVYAAVFGSSEVQCMVVYCRDA